jgi:DNA polymerase-3 subunit beta
MPGIIVPRKTVLDVVKLLEGEEGEVEIALSASKIRFTVGNLVLTSKLIDGTFPDYERVIPRNNDKVLDVDTKLLAPSTAYPRSRWKRAGR